jgi:hypothetical protein
LRTAIVSGSRAWPGPAAEPPRLAAGRDDVGGVPEVMGFDEASSAQ